MLTSAAATYVERFGVVLGDRVTVVTTNGEAVDSSNHSAPPESTCRPFGPDAPPEADEHTSLLVSGGWNPNLGLWRGIGGSVRYDDERACFVPRSGASLARDDGERHAATGCRRSIPFGSSTVIGRHRSSICSGTRPSPTSPTPSTLGSHPWST